jgi:hypothetical protein
MCVNGKSWCKGVGYFDRSKVCLQCQSADAAHEGMAKKKPPPVVWPDRATGQDTSLPVLGSTVLSGGTQLIATTPTARRLLPSAKVIDKPATTGGPLPVRSSSPQPLVQCDEGAPTDPYKRRPGESEGAWENRVRKMKRALEVRAPDSQSGHVFRGEDPAAGGKPGRTPQELIVHGGFQPWQIKSIAEARSAVQTLCSGTTSLQQRAYGWQKNKERVDGYFVSTGTSTTDAYDNYTYFYRVAIPMLMRRDWSAAGIEGLNLDNVRDCHLYLDGATVGSSQFIAILCLTEQARLYELLVMTPMTVAMIEIKVEGQWKKLSTQKT